jgi:hydrogenase nickel incorporation protein HypB
VIRVGSNPLADNADQAQDNRARLAASGTLAVNLMSLPGAGKTTLLCRTIADLGRRFPIAAVVGDLQTDDDVERLQSAGARTAQVDSGKGGPLTAATLKAAIDALPLAPGGLLLIENVGDLVATAGVDLGETVKVVVLSTTEGEDKPRKYPDALAVADLLLLNKSDLLPHLEFDVGRCLAAALRVNPHLQTLVVSAETGDGMAAFYAWIEARVGFARSQAVTQG